MYGFYTVRKYCIICVKAQKLGTKIHNLCLSTTISCISDGLWQPSLQYFKAGALYLNRSINSRGGTGLHLKDVLEYIQKPFHTRLFHKTI